MLFSPYPKGTQTDITRPFLPRLFICIQREALPMQTGLLTQSYLCQVQAVHPGDLAERVWSDKDHHEADGTARPAAGRGQRLDFSSIRSLTESH